MLKNIIAIILLSILVILFMPWAQKGLQYLVQVHDWVSDSLKDVFSMGETGTDIRQLIAILAVPVIITLIPTLIYRLARHAWFPWALHVLWMIWLIEISAIVLLYAPPK